jgi:hypothetical protein
MAAVTLYREPKSLAEKVAALVAGRLGLSLVDKTGLA